MVRINRTLFEEGTYQELVLGSLVSPQVAKPTLDSEEYLLIQELEKFSYITLWTKSNTSPQIELIGTAQYRKTAKRVIPAGLLPRALFLHNHHQPSHSFISLTFPLHTITRPGRMS